MVFIWLALTPGLASADSLQAMSVIGDRLAAKGFQFFGLPVEDDEVQQYVNLVGAAAARNAGRPDAPFYFTAIDNDRIIASWSCPGGIVAITTGFLRVMENEAELAGVLAHELAHVSRRHCLQSYGQTDFKQSAEGLDHLIERLASIVFETGLTASLEHDADVRGMETAFRTGYDPLAFVQLLTRLQELPDAVQLPGSWFLTHPPLVERIRRCRARLTGFRNLTGMARAADRFAKTLERLP